MTTRRGCEKHVIGKMVDMVPATEGVVVAAVALASGEAAEAADSVEEVIERGEDSIWINQDVAGTQFVGNTTICI
jgi:hypothetical protein